MGSLLSIQGLKSVIDLEGGPPVRAVDGVDLYLQPRELLALVGESGCGKTMLALSIGRLLPPRGRVVDGQVEFQGKDLLHLAEEELRLLRGGRLAYIFQDPMSALNPVMTIGEQLTEAIHLHRGLSGRAAQEFAVQLLTQVKIPSAAQRFRQYAHQFSGGMRQRVMIAMALAGQPALLIADEPTTALDVTIQAEILRLLKEFRDQRGMAILLITHDLAAVAPHADRVAVMYAGRIVEVAPTRELYEHPSHPYTQAVLACIPKPGKGRQPFQSIPGSVPDLRFTPSGCPFHPRCPEVIERCRGEHPELKAITPGHTVRCWRREAPDA